VASSSSICFFVAENRAKWRDPKAEKQGKTCKRKCSGENYWVGLGGLK